MREHVLSFGGDQLDCFDLIILINYQKIDLSAISVRTGNPLRRTLVGGQMGELVGWLVVDETKHWLLFKSFRYKVTESFVKPCLSWTVFLPRIPAIMIMNVNSAILFRENKNKP